MACRPEVADEKCDLRPRAVEVHERNMRLHHELIAEPPGLLVRIYVAADPREEGGVVDDAAFLLVEPEPLAEPQRDQTLPQDVFHRLPKPEIHTQGQHCNKLREPHRGLRLFSHEPNLTSSRASTSRRSCGVIGFGSTGDGERRQGTVEPSATAVGRAGLRSEDWMKVDGGGRKSTSARARAARGQVRVSRR